MNTNMERDHLVQAERHIAECKAHIARQRELIEQLREDDHETDVAESMLHALEGSLQAFETHRKLILDRLEDADR